MAKYIWRDGDWREVVWTPPRKAVAPYVWSDLPAYKSPLGTGVVDGRKARREDLKRGGCREVDPSEFKPGYINENFTKPRGLQVSKDGEGLRPIERPKLEG